jgi:hypothetical protein
MKYIFGEVAILSVLKNGHDEIFLILGCNCPAFIKEDRAIFEILPLI